MVNAINSLNDLQSCFSKEMNDSLDVLDRNANNPNFLSVKSHMFDIQHHGSTYQIQLVVTRDVDDFINEEDE